MRSANISQEAPSIAPVHGQQRFEQASSRGNNDPVTDKPDPIAALRHAAADVARLQRDLPRPARVLSSSSLEILARALGCGWATYWEVDPALRVLRPTSRWKESGLAAQKLERDTENRTLTLSEGTAGHVWRSRRPVWTLDLASDMCLPRSLDAEDAGLQGGVWFAVKTDTTVYGVVELLGHSLPPSHDALIAGVEEVGVQLGEALAECDMPS